MKKTLIAAAASVLVLAGCGGSDTDTEPTITPEAQVLPETTPTPIPTDVATPTSPPTPEPQVSWDSVPDGFENAFPVTIEWEWEGWTYATTFYGGPTASMTKVIENSPPGYAMLELDWLGDLSHSGPISLDEGRNAPNPEHYEKWGLWWSASSLDNAAQRTALCRAHEYGPDLGYACFMPDEAFTRHPTGPRDEREEQYIDASLGIFDDGLDGVIVGVDDQGIYGGTATACYVKVMENGTLTEYGPYEGLGDATGSACINYYQGEVR